MERMILSERDIPRKAWLLGWVSFFNELSSNMIYPILPLFFIQILQIPVFLIGVIEGISKAAGAILPVLYSRILKGIKKKRDMLYLGYGISAFARPLFFMVITFPQTLLVRCIDCLGEGFHKPTVEDVLKTDTDSATYNKILLSNRTKFVLGAILGPLLAYSLYLYFFGNYRAIFWLSVVPAVIGLLIIGSLKNEECDAKSEPAPAFTFRIRDYGGDFRKFLIIAMIGAFANFSYFFVFILGSISSYRPDQLLLLWAGANIAATVSLVYFARISTSFSHRKALILSLILQATIWYGFANCINLPPFFKAISFFALLLGLGFYSGLSGGLMNRFISDLVPPEIVPKARLTFNFYTGIMLLFSNLLAGYVWKAVGPSYTFLVGASVASLCGMLLIFIKVGRDQTNKEKPKGQAHSNHSISP
ncbi:MAG: MFS transporter [Candidatus Aureabacteria bacterium]|nr:MFS transporter [Candidatus Auribacterota bacterium]